MTTVTSLPSRSDFDCIFKSPELKASNRDFLILARLRPRLTDQSRIGFVTSKKKLRRAVDRNRFRRSIREYLRKHPIPLSIDCVVIAKACPENLDHPSFQEEIRAVFDKLHRKLERIQDQ